jgi:hypothetical protein
MLDPNKPVTGRDLELLREDLQLTITDFVWLFGFTYYAYCQIRSQDEDKRDPATGLLPIDQPINDPAVCILARWLAKHPEDCPVPRPPTAAQIFRRLEAAMAAQGRNMPKRFFGVVLGREVSASYRWIEQGGDIPAALSRMLIVLDRKITDTDPSVWDEIVQVANEEASVRGINLMKEARWRRRGTGAGKANGSSAKKLAVDELGTEEAAKTATPARRGRKPAVARSA